jgi:hypothetical protein
LQFIDLKRVPERSGSFGRNVTALTLLTAPWKRRSRLRQGDGEHLKPTCRFVHRHWHRVCLLGRDSMDPGSVGAARLSILGASPCLRAGAGMDIQA